MKSFSITRISHAEIFVSDLRRAKTFYVEALGMLLIDEQKDCLYLGCYEERDKYSLLVRKGPQAGVGHLAFRVSDEEDIDRLEHLYRKSSLPSRIIEENTEEDGQGRALRAQDPCGLPIEFVYSMEQRPWLRQRFDLFRGANIMRIDHFNCQIPDVQKGYDWWTQMLGFRLSESTVTDEDSPQLWAAWLHRKQNVHDIALMNGKGPRLHHVGLWCQDTLSILKACDVLASMGMTECIERGPGRHGLSNAFFLYLRDFEGNRIELYTNDYLIPDPDFKPVVWKLNDERRATFWGHQPPESWFSEASQVKNIETDTWMPVEQALLKGKPEFAT
jgi:3,4-dihydroxyphenylacetate 2,3-dioxygenase